MKTADLPLRNSIQCLFALVPLLLATFWLSARVQAVSPAPDGGYSGGNTAEGTNALFSLTSGVWNTAIGHQSLYHVSTGRQNTATGYQTLFSNTTGSLSTAYGSQSLYNNTTGSFNTATGFRTLYANTVGSQNTGIGYEALNFNTTGHDNTANGYQALYSNSTDSFNTATGSQALYHNRVETLHGGSANTANGYQALYSNTNGSFNTATGVQALNGNTTGQLNTANGFGALSNNTDGYQNTATGVQALASNGTGSGNTANGNYALTVNHAGDDNTADGFYALGNCTTCSDNTALGWGAGLNLLDGDNNIYVGNPGVDTESGTLRIGIAGTQTQTFIAGIFNVSEGGTILPVYINSDGQLGTQPPASSQRFKKDIKPMQEASESILALKPVSFHYKSDNTNTPQFGLVAEEVASVNPDLVVRDKDGKPYTVRYEAVNAMLLNEFLKEHREVQELKKQIEALTAGLQKVSAQLEAGKPAPQVVTNP